ncbi:MAG TPA: glycosyltransferase family 9 protein [Candidatus Acidoferrales bacterium]|nr:glycosyltransferase family 9 protein [Candidatus Acidoferrales bacterium]
MKESDIDRSKIKRILIIKPRAIGDVLLSTAVLPNLRWEFPAAHIDFLVESFAASVLNGNPFIDQVVSFNAQTQSSVSIILRVRKNNYDLIIDLFANPRTAIITLCSGAKFRIGYPFKWRRFAYNILVPSRSGEHHNVEFNLDALRQIGIPIQQSQPLFYLDETSKLFGNKFLEEHDLHHGTFVTINIGGGWEIKRWKADQFIDLCLMIHDRLNLDVVILYGPSEKVEAEDISSSSNSILAPETSLHEMGAIMDESLLLITNDSGPMHIAAALDIPTLAIFGPTNPRSQGPYGNISEIARNEKLDCLECNLTKCPIGNPCMKELDAEIVYEKLTCLISKIRRGKPAESTPRFSKERKLDESI